MPSKKTKTPTKKAKPSKKAAAVDKRVRKAPKYKSFRLQKKIKHPKGAPVGLRRILDKSFSLLLDLKKPLFWLLLVYAVFSILFVRGFSAPFDISQTRADIQEILGDSIGSFTTNVAILGLLIGSSSTASAESGVYQGIFALIFSLALIWLFRQHTAGNRPSAKLALYRSSYPLVPFILVLTVIVLQLLPLLIGTTVLTIVLDTGIAVSGLEQALWILLTILLGILSLYLISSSIFALYIVTLPDMTPLKALRSARQLVVHRRFAVLRRLLWIPLIVLVVLAGIMLPTIFFVSWLAPWMYFVLTLLFLPFLHAYIYTLYRELL